MQREIAIPPQVSAYSAARPSQCPYCGGGIFHRHGEVRTRVKDIYVAAVAAMRYFCVGCKCHSRAIRRELTAMDAASG